MIYTVDMDNTICHTIGNDYANCVPWQEAIDKINKLYDEGNTIQIFTSRGAKSGIDWREFTVKQLRNWGVKYHSLIMSKPSTDVFIDDKAVNTSDWLRDGSEDKEAFNSLVELIVGAYKSSNKVLVCGNGGLCSASEHFAAELMGKFAFDVYVPCIALTTNTSLITALANDLGYENVFAHQVRTLGKPSDILIAMTTSQSPNILEALKEAKQNGLATVAICGTMSEEIVADYVFRMSGGDVAQMQDETLVFLHKLAYRIKETLID